MSENLPHELEPGGAKLVKNGIQFTSEGLYQYADYSAIEGPLKGEMSIFGPLLIETVQPPSSATQLPTIQLHKLTGNEDLSHLLLVYHHCSAAKAVIFVNTSDDFQLPKNLLDTLSVPSKEYSEMLCLIITNSVGTDLLGRFRLFSSIQCTITSVSVDSMYLPRPETDPRAPPRHLQGSEDKRSEEIDSLIDKMNECLTLDPKKFENVMKLFLQMEEKKNFFSSRIVVSPVIWCLLKPSRFSEMFGKDFPFYAVVAWRLLKKNSVFDLKKEQTSIFCKVCVEGLYATSPEVLNDILEGFIKRGNFDAKISISERLDIFVVLGNAFSKLCKSWLKENERPDGIPCKYWGIALLCMSLSLKMYSVSSQQILKEQLWETHILNHYKRLPWGQEAFCEIRKGFECMRTLITPTAGFGLQHLTELLTKQNVIPFLWLHTLVLTVQEFYIDSWNQDLLNFLRLIRDKYRKHIFGKKVINYVGVSKQEGMFGAFHECWMFIITVIEFLREKSALEDPCMIGECKSWFTMAIQLIIFKNNECLKCVGIIIQHSKILPILGTFCVEEMNDRFSESCRQLTVEEFQPIYCATKYWFSSILEIYIRSFKPQPDTVICCTQWQALLSRWSNRKNPKILIDFLKSVGKKYADSGRASNFIFDLLKLDVPELFHSQADCQTFSQDLRMYINTNSLRNTFLKNFLYILECLPLKPHSFWMLIVSVIVQETFIEMNSSDQQSVQQILDTASSLVHYFLNQGNMYNTAKAECVFGALNCICSRIAISEESLNWLKDSNNLLVRICSCFKPFCETGERDGDISQCLNSTSISQEVKRFLNFYLELQRVLKRWKEKVKIQDVTQSDIAHLRTFYRLFNGICIKSYIPESSIKELEIQQLADSCEDIKNRLQENFILSVTGKSWCHLSDILRKLGVSYPAEIQRQIEQLVSLPAYSETSAVEGLSSLQQIPPIKLTEKSNMRSVAQLLTSLLKFINPLSSHLRAIVFLYIYDCKLFFSYTSYYLKKSKALNTSVTVSVKPTLQSDDPNYERISCAAEAASLALCLLQKVIDGSATLNEVFLNDTINLSPSNIEHELEVLKEFISNDIPFDVSTHGLKGYIELQAIVTNIPVISDVLKQFGLHNCQKSVQHTLLKDTAERMRNIGTMTLLQAKEKLCEVKETLQLSGKTNLSCFKLFRAVERNAPFYRFAKRMGFTGVNGRDTFLSRYRMVALQLQHEEYNQAVLHHLYGSYKYISPFFDKEVHFEQLIEEIVQLPDISMGVNHLEQVAANIMMIKVWFENAEGETTENVKKTLVAVLHSGNIVFQTNADIHEVHFKLVYNPNYLAKDQADFAESLYISLEDRKVEPCHFADQTKEWTIEEMNDFSIKLGFVQCEIRDETVDIFKESHENCLMLLRIYQDLKFLGHPKYQDFEKCFQTSIDTVDENVLKNEVTVAEENLQEWSDETDKCRREFAELAFFSNEKVMRILKILQSGQLASVPLVREIAFLYKSDQNTNGILTKAVEGVLHNFTSQDSSINCAENLPVKVVGKFLRSIFANLPLKICLYPIIPTRPIPMPAILPMNSKFTLHSVHNLNPLQMLQLIFTVFHGVPNSFQIFQCTLNTTKQHLDIFFDGAFHWSDFQEHFKYLLLGVNYLHNELQEMLVKKCCDWKTCTSIHFVEYSQSVLRLIPSVSIFEHRDCAKLDCSIGSILNDCGVKRMYKRFLLVFGQAGNGKSHYIKGDLMQYFKNNCVIITLNESFNELDIIKQLQETLTRHSPQALYLNFTFVPPIESEGDQEHKQYKLLSDRINWFFTRLLIFGYVEDISTGESFRMSYDSQWCVYVEVPSLDHKDPHESIKKFTECYSVFDVLGTKKLIDSDIPYACDDHVQLVCKYLKAMKENTLDKVLGESTGEIRIGSMTALSTEEYCGLLKEYMPPHVWSRKISQKLYIRYMYRRCHFLEECPYLKYNQGRAPGDAVRDKTGKMVHKNYKDTSKLRSVLFHTMRREVAHFSEQCVGTHEQTRKYHQLVYDFQKGEGNFSLLSYTDTDEHSDELLQIEEFRKLGFELPNRRQLHECDTLHKILARGLGVHYNPETGHIDLLDNMQYVMTLDFAVKMLTIHERRLCGIPVVIKGETGVGKTFLLETLSALWNRALLTMLEHEREGLRDSLKRDLNNYLLHNKAKQDEEQSRAVMEACECISGEKEMSISSISFIFEKKAFSKNEKFLYEKYLRMLLGHKTDPIFSILKLPKCVKQCYQNFSSLFCTAEKPEKDIKKVVHVTSYLLYAVLYGEMPNTFYKLSVHSALSPKQIKEFFEPIIKLAAQMLENFESCLLKPSDGYNKYRHPVITVFLDEINTSSCIGVLKEIVVDKTLNGKKLPSNIFIVAACNPYRGDSLISLQITQEVKPTSTETSDDHWFCGSYYVRPLNPTLELLMWDYKALDPSREREFVYSKMSVTLSRAESSDLTEPIVKSQELIRKYAFESLVSSGIKEVEAKERSSSTVSQRDIQRAFNFYTWLLSLFSSVERYQEESPKKKHLRALYVALAIVYYFRLDRKCRKDYAEEMDNFNVLGIDKKPVNFSEALRDELDWLITETTLPPGVARTEALKENLYATVVCTMTRTPLIIVGAPGSSKTLSFKITVSNLQGLESTNEIFRNEFVFHALEPTIYQCSRRSTSTEIEGIFSKAITSQKFFKSTGQNCYSVVMMDEAGLPEESHESLKVLHVHLDNQEVSFVGISNHVLDAAKSNRAVSLFRPETSEKDVRELASVCLEDQPGLIEGICRAYMIKMKSEKFRKFYGLRDFIHFFTYLQRHKMNYVEVATPQMIMQALERNFNGSDQFHNICECFLKEMGYSYKRLKQRNVLAVLKDSLGGDVKKTISSQNDESFRLAEYSEGETGKQKDLSAENEVRYKLIIDSSEDESVIRFLFTFGVLQRKNTRMYICSKFPGDGETQKINTIAAIRHSALQGHTVILSQTDEIHESFYDLFNQRFTCIHNHEGVKQYFTNIAIGPHVKPSRVDPHFQCVVVIKQSELHRTPAPFLNRFEKYALNHQSLLEDVVDSYPRRLRNLVYTAKDKVKDFLKLFGDSNGLYGQNRYTLDSLLLTVMPPYKPVAAIQTSVDCSDLTGIHRLLYCLTSVLKMKTGIYICMVSGNLATDAEHVANNVKRDVEFSACLDGLKDEFIPEIVVETIDVLLKQDDRVTVSRTVCMVTAFLEQWLVTYLCEKLMQLMTPETLIANHKKIPTHYIDVYLNHQHHFNLIGLIGDHHGALSQTRPIPNKLLCYSRSSPLIHTSFQTDSSSLIGKDTNILSPTIEQLVFSYSSTHERSLQNRLSVLKITAISTQSSIFRGLQSFMQSETHEVKLIVVNMQYSTVEIVNHLRIMIEEAETQFKSSEELNKLFVVLLHFPPEMFFNHCYPSLFLTGWDHYYLDTIAPPQEKGVVDICQWFSHCCGAVNCKNSAEFLNDPLEEIMEEAIPALAAQFSMAKVVSSEQNKVDMLKQIFIESGLGKIVRNRFISYWLTSVITEVSEQAANYPHMYESTLSITDAILTIVKSSFYDFLFFVLCTLRKQCVLEPLSQHDQKHQELIQLSFDLFQDYPLPKNLAHLKAASMSEVRRVHVEDTSYLQRCRYPFFPFISNLIENLLDQCKKEVNLLMQRSTEQDNDENQPSIVIKSEKDVRQALCDTAKRKLTSETEIQDLKILNTALQAMEQSDELWSRYFEALIVSKFSFHSEHNLQSIKVLSDLFSDFQELEIRRRVIELHAYIKYCGLDSNLLTVLRFLDSMYQRSRAMSNTLDSKSIVPYFHGGKKDIVSLVISSMYTSVCDACQSKEETSRNTIGEMSSYYHAIILVPAMKELFSEISGKDMDKLKVLHVTFLIHNSGMKKATADAIKLFTSLNDKVKSQESHTISLRAVVIEAIEVMVPKITVVEAINSPSNFQCVSGIHYVLRDLFKQFLPTHDTEDFQWLLEVANNPTVMQISCTSPTARCIRQCIFMILTSGKHEQTDEIMNLLLQNRNSLEMQTFGAYIAGCEEDDPGIEYVPIHYLKCSLLHPTKDLVQQPLARVYSSLILEALRKKELSLAYILRLHGHVAEGIGEQSAKGDLFIQKIWEQTIIQYLIETLAKFLATKKDIYEELAEVLNRINPILKSQNASREAMGLECHGVMLGLQLLKAHRSSHTFFRAMTTKFDDLYGDFDCLHPLNTILQSSKEVDSIADQHHIFPFDVMKKEKLYTEISKMLEDLYKSPSERMKHGLLRIADKCYSGAEEDAFGRKMRNKFNMLLWLSIYKDFYCKKVRRKPAFVKVLKENLTQYMEPEYLDLILKFAGFDHSGQHPPVGTVPRSVEEIFQPQWRGYLKHFNTIMQEFNYLFQSSIDQYSELKDTIAYLVATLLGSCDHLCHLHTHAFMPKQILGTYVPGTMRYDNPVGDKIFYNECIHLATNEFLPGIHHLAGKSTCTMSLHCYYFTHWANYAALCISHLINPHAADDLFLNNFDVRQHCFTSMLDMWNMMGQHLHLTTEHKWTLINNWLGRVYDYAFTNGHITDLKQLWKYEQDWNKLFEITWKSTTETMVKKPLLPYNAEINEMFRQMDEVFPVHANPTDFFLQLFSSTTLDKEEGYLYSLYQFILLRPKLNAGGMLLPDLVNFYLWSHNELNYTVTLDDAEKVTVGEMLNLYLEKHYLGGDKKRIVETFETVADSYQVYRNAVGHSTLPPLSISTPLIDILTTPQGSNLLYRTITQIVNSFNGFLESIKCSVVVSQRYYAQANDTKKQMLTEISEADCCFGTAVRLDDLNELMPLISECCNPVKFSDADNPLTSVDPTILPCCVPQLFDFVELQEDIIHSFVAGKCPLQSPQKIRIPFNFKEQSKPQKLPGNILQGAAFEMKSLEKLSQMFRVTLDENTLKRTEFECHSMTYYTLLEVTIGLRNAANYLLMESLETASKCQQQTLSEFIKTTVAPGTEDVLNQLGVQTKRVNGLTKSQCYYLQNIKLVHLYKTLQLLVEWLELGMYDFCSLSIAMKVHLTEKSKQIIHNTVMSSHGLGVATPIITINELKCFQSLLVQSESVLRNTVHTNLMKPLKDILPVTDLTKTNVLVKECLTDDVLVCHYVHLRMELRRLYIDLQFAIGDEVVEQHAMVKKWDDWATDIWDTFGYDRQDSPESSMTVPVDPGVTFYPHKNKWGLQMDSLETDLQDLVKRKNQSQPQHPEELTDHDESTPSGNTQNAQPKQVTPSNPIHDEEIDEDHVLELAERDSSTQLAEYLKSIGMEKFTEPVIKNDVTGEMAIGEDGEEIMSEHGMSAVTFIRFRVLYRRHLLQQKSELAIRCPVEKVVKFFKQFSVLANHVEVIMKNDLDGEMLLEAPKQVFDELNISATGRNKIQKKLKEFAFRKP